MHAHNVPHQQQKLPNAVGTHWTATLNSLHLKLVIIDSGLTKIRRYLPLMSIKSSLSFSPHIKATESPRDAKEATYNNHKQSVHPSLSLL